MANEFLFTLPMVRSWQHSEPCLAGQKDSCICGLTALVGRLERQTSNPRAVFTINISLPDGQDSSRPEDHRPTDTQRFDWWFARGMDDSVCDGSVDLWWADEDEHENAVVRVTHGTSVRDAMDKAMRGIYDPESLSREPAP